MSENRLTLLGRGCNSEIFAYGQGQAKVVLKVVCSMSKKEQRHLRNEFQVLKTLEHQHIIKALRYQEKVAFQGNKLDKQSTTTNSILVLEYAHKGSLLQYMQHHQLTLHNKSQLFHQLLSAIHYLHTQKIAHRDLKLDNVLISQQNDEAWVKLSDFGFASQFEKDGKRVMFAEYKGTKKGYMAPEIHYCHKENDTPYDAAKTDIFALGVLLFALVLGKLPFEIAVEENKLYKLLIDKKYEEFWSFHYQINAIFEQNTNKMAQFQQMFQRMVSFDVEERPSTEELIKNSWIL